MPDEPTPDVRTVRLGLELRHIRLEQNLTLQKAHELLNRSVSSISRIEKGQVKLPERDLPPILDAYGITDPTRRKALQALTRGPSAKDWWQSYRDVLTVYPTFISMENEAEKIRVFENMFLPGLLQTPEYARAIYRAGQPDRPDFEIKRLTAVRIRRQQILDRANPPDLHAIIAEGALRQLVGGRTIMKQQLEHLLIANSRPAVEVQVLPFSAGAHAAPGSFNLLSVPALRGDIVHIDQSAQRGFLDDAEAARRYNLVFDMIRAAALPATESRALIEHLSGEL